MDKRDIIVLTLLFLASFYLRTLPVQQNTYPFGEGDAAHQIGRADWMAWADSASEKLPYSLAVWYRHNPKDFFAQINAAPFMINAAMLQIIGGHRFQGINLYYAIISNFVIIMSVYFVVRKLYGFYPAILSGFLLLFPFRNLMFYLWGQRPVMLGLAFVPLTCYCYYRYTDSFLNNQQKPTYFFLSAILMAIGGFFHPMTLVVSGSALSVFTLFLMIKEKKFPLDTTMLIISVVVFAVIFAPFLPTYFGQSGVAPTELKITRLSSLFKWFEFPSPNPPNAFLYSYKAVHGGLWTLPFLLLGILFLLIRRHRKDLIMLSWLIGLYIALHLPVLNYVNRIDRVLTGSSHIFYPLIAIGLLGLPSLIKLPKNTKNYVKFALIISFFILTLNFNAKQNYEHLKNAYQFPLRMTDAQYDVAKWIEANLPEDSYTFTIGTLTYPKSRWVHVFSHRALRPAENNDPFEKAYHDKIEYLEKNPTPYHTSFTHMLIDYSDLMLLRNNPTYAQRIQELQQFEQKYTANATLLYDKNNIKVYKLV
jgi:hypothetical protein